MIAHMHIAALFKLCHGGLGPHVDLGGISLGITDELGNGLGRYRWIDQHDIGYASAYAPFPHAGAVG
jgi:hypothetical protein